MATNDNGSELTMFLFGAAVGAVAGILLAPKPGSETREQLGDWLNERREQGTDFIHKMNDLKDKTVAKKHQISAALKAGKDAYYGTAETKEEPLNV